MGLALGCSVNVAYPVGLQCNQGECPGGQRCEASTNTCALGAPGDAGTDGVTDAAAGFPRGCGGSAAYVEPYSTAESAWFFAPLRAGVSIDGALVLGVPDGATEVLAAGGPRLDLLDSHWYARVEPAESGSTIVRIKNDGPEEVAFQVMAGMLSMTQNHQSQVAIPFEPALHRYIGFREKQGKLHFVTSPDGVEFASLHTIDTPAFVSSFQAIMSVEGAEGTVATIDDINGGVPSSYTFCPANQVSDRFAGANLSGKWNVFGSCANVDVTGGEVILVSNPGGFCVLALSGLHNLINSEFVLELGSVFSGYYKLAIDGEQGEFIVERFDTELRVRDCPNGVCGPPTVAPYVGERFLRLSGDSEGRAVFSFSADGENYVEVNSATPFDLRATKLRFHGNTDSDNRVTAFN